MERGVEISARTVRGVRAYEAWLEKASMRTVADVTREELLVDPFHPKIGGERAAD